MISYQNYQELSGHSQPTIAKIFDDSRYAATGPMAHRRGRHREGDAATEAYETPGWWAPRRM
jgi:hypothetical protein